MKTIEIETCEFVEDDNGGHFVHTKRYEDFTDDQVRHNDLCTLCGFPSYPECMKFCQNENGERS